MNIFGRTVMAFQSSPTPQYIPVPIVGLQLFPQPPLLPGMYQVPSQPQTFPNKRYNQAVDQPLMTAQTIYNYERAGRMQY